MTTMRQIRSTPPLGTEELRLPAGYRAAGVAAGIKAGAERPDMALIVSDQPAVVAGVFTTNQVQAAPVRLDREHLRGRIARAIVVNSGNANACTGPRGRRDALRMAAETARRLGVPVRQVFVCSTGTIGVPLPMDRVLVGIERLVAQLSPDGAEAAATAILTTDTRPKRWTVPLSIGGRPAIVAGFAKGAGMIEPRMATMLAFLLTDVAAPAGALQRLLRAAADESFNRITVDGDRSTNDTALLLANGASGIRLAPGRPGWREFERAVRATARALARMIVADGEGATRFITVRVRGARSDREADLAARSVANSLLVKTAWAGPNANWGRVMDALGYSAAKVVESRVAIWFDGLCAVRRGAPGPATREQLREVIARPEFTVEIDLGLGRGRAEIWTCNCTEEYVRINM
ncbi:MAG: bifunctional glutamate N-acetyltransferase/amino-acid acetyltransferase ArgJ [Kiritimatiellae bacterium]|nr:bifunctional glutamate N-acetyltransferase/amino-acid acetyltransferase ArgJ [Kiritimatiellia bacterium]